MLCGRPSRAARLPDAPDAHSSRIPCPAFMLPCPLVRPYRPMSASAAARLCRPQMYGEGRVHARWSRVSNSSVAWRRHALQSNGGRSSGWQLRPRGWAGRFTATSRTPGSVRARRSRGGWSVRTIVSSVEAPVRMPTSAPVASRSAFCVSTSATPTPCSPTPATQDCGYGD
jgi:hypothetical protein